MYARRALPEGSQIVFYCPMICRIKDSHVIVDTNVATFAMNSLRAVIAAWLNVSQRSRAGSGMKRSAEW